MIKFADDQNLGKVVSSQNIFSEIGNMPISNKNQLTIAGGRHKMSRLCGFLFTSTVNNEFPQFGIVFICKLRSKINHQQKKYVDLQWTIPSRWFALSRISGNSLNVMNKKTVMELYNFDVDKFFKSDLFVEEAKKLQKTISKGIKQARDFAEKLKDPTEKKNAIEEVSSIELSIPLIAETRFEDKNYKLVNYEMKENKELNEASRFECYVKAEKQDGKEVFSVYEKDGNMWVATFQSEESAKQFAEEFPAKKEEYINQATEKEELKEADDREPLSHALDPVGVKASTANSIEQDAVEMQLIEKEIDADIEEAMKEIYK